MTAVLVIDGVETPLSPDHSLRFYINPDDGYAVTPVLYLNGMRTTKPWSLRLEADVAGTPKQANSNTA